MPKFRGYSRPTYTPVPDELFDEQLPDLSGAELKVLLYIIRRTFGFKKDSDTISLNQICKGIVTRDGRVLDRGTGLNKDTVTKAIKSLEEGGYILREHNSSPERGFEATTYALNFAPLSENPTTLLGKIRQASPEESDKPLSGKSDTQQPNKQQTANNRRYTSKKQKDEPYDEEEHAERLRRSVERLGPGFLDEIG
jgi:DNA-binding MarR family transcriptional regulator